MMPSTSSRTAGQRLIAVVLALTMLQPTSATVTRADDDLPTPELITPGPREAPAPTPAPMLPPTRTPRATSTPSAVPTAAPTPVPTMAPASAADEKPRGAAAESALSACQPPPGIKPTSWELAGNDAVNQMRDAVDATFKSIEAREIGVSGQIVGFRPGALYSHIYARDSATVAPTAQYLYDLPYLTRPVEEFLALQYDGENGDPEDAYWRTPGQHGAISGTIGGGEIAGAKMLVVSDEEPSLVTMAYVAVKAGAGAAWLLQEQAGKPRIQRLNEAMDWIFEHRFDKELRSIKRGNTTDWGDVAVGQGHSSGSYVKEPDDWTASIYDQAWNYRALMQLAELNTMVDQPEIAEHQLSRARLLRQSVAERFWQPDRGYFRTRIPLPPLPREVDEDSIVSIANGVAVYAGITDPSERKPVFSALETARTQAGAPKPGLTLWPPYPAGFFDYPQMVPGRYQNGAVWDWWGGMQISGEFWTGYSALGRNHLNMVARDWQREPGEIYEWQETGSRKNSGSTAYVGAAATMAEAIIAGLFGVEIGPEGWTLSPRLGAQSGGIHAYHQASGCFIDYWQNYAGESLALEWETAHPNPGTIQIVLPNNVRVESALLDQKPVRTRLEQLGDDVIAVLASPAPSGKHRLELRLVAGNE
jgi:hypothetical protein